MAEPWLTCWPELLASQLKGTAVFGSSDQKIGDIINQSINIPTFFS
jgi:hypothetical protein